MIVMTTKKGKKKGRRGRKSRKKRTILDVNIDDEIDTFTNENQYKKKFYNGDQYKILKNIFGNNYTNLSVKILVDLLLYNLKLLKKL